MISKNHHQNTNFQILYFLAGSCHTPDAAYCLLLDLREERDRAIKSYQVSKIKEKAKIIRINRLINSEDEADRLDGEAQLLEIKNNIEQGEILYKAAVDELAFIDECLAKIKPYCKYKDLPDDEACQAMQQEEWKLELIHRAENELLTTGTISAEQFNNMRMHPEFQTVIFPQVNNIVETLKNGTAQRKYLQNPLVKLLEA